MELKKLTYFKEINEYFYLTRYPRDEFIELFNDCLKWAELDCERDDEMCRSIWESASNHLNYNGDDNKWEVLRQYCDFDEMDFSEAINKFNDDLIAVGRKIRKQNMSNYNDDGME